jgi:phage replication-related protein YjqB (UPF0714/DUF867 family)
MDTYPNFSLLLQHEHDFVIEQVDRGATTTIVAPHGGAIEPQTSDIARLIAGDDHNYFLFNGTKNADNDALHITSHRWDHPSGLALVARSLRVITVHGCRAGEAVVIVGGRDVRLRDLIAEEMDRRSLPAVIGATGRHSGRHHRNICNRGLTGSGVQLEISRPLRDDPSCWQALAGAVRTAISRCRNRRG